MKETSVSYIDGNHMSPTFVADESEDFIRIGGALDESSDPRKLRALYGSGVRMRNLKLVDSHRWQYTVMILLFIDFVVVLLAISFSSSSNFDSGFATFSRYFSAVLLILYFVDMLVRVSGLKSALLRSNSTVADLCCLILLLGLSMCRHLFHDIEYEVSVVYLSFLSLRLILKPRARRFSKKLHNFGNTESTIRVSMESVRASLRRIPGVSAVAVEMMETDLVIICGRDEGDMSCDELMLFLERALRYRPKELSATEFLSHLQDVDAQSIKYAYGAADVIRSTLWHWSSQKCDLLLSLIVIAINATVIPAQSYLVGYVVDNALSNNNNTGTDPNDALFYGVLGILLLCIPFVLGNYGIGYFQSKMISKATERMQTSLLDIILKQNTAFFNDRSEGDLNNLFASDIARVGALWQSVFWSLLNPLVSVVFGFGFILITDWPTGVAAFAFTGALLSSGPQGFASKKSKEFGSKNAYATAEFQNYISCQKVIRSYSIRDAVVKRFSFHCADLREASFSKDFWASVVQIYVESAMYIFVAIQTAALAIKTQNGDIEVGTFFTFVTMLSRISSPVTTLGGFMRIAIGNASSLQRLDDVLMDSIKDRDKDRNNHSIIPELPKLRRSLQFKNVYFKYDKGDNYILSNLSFTIPMGAYTCVCGPSGSGKSTILSCLMQFYDIDAGTITFDDNDISKCSKSSFKNQVAVVFQEISILNGSILENIRYGNLNATDAECMEAAKLAECNFIDNLRDGFDTVIGQHAACSLSGGQAQRVCLARALCRKPSVLLLDEATSALDPETESSIIGTLERLSRKMHMTIISITHRLQTAQNADLILVLNQGSVAESGTFKYLTSVKGSLFSEMLNFQDSSDGNDISCEVVDNRDEHPAAASTNDHDSDPSKLLRQFTKHFIARVDSGLSDTVESSNSLIFRNHVRSSRHSKHSPKSPGYRRTFGSMKNYESPKNDNIPKNSAVSEAQDTTTQLSFISQIDRRMRDRDNSISSQSNRSESELSSYLVL